MFARLALAGLIVAAAAVILAPGVDAATDDMQACPVKANLGLSDVLSTGPALRAKLAGATEESVSFAQNPSIPDPASVVQYGLCVVRTCVSVDNCDDCLTQRS